MAPRRPASEEPPAKRGAPTRTAPRTTGDVDLVHGPLHLMILKILTWGPLHGYAIARSIRGLTGDVLAIEEGSLYPALHRMEDRGWVEAEWGLSDGNRRARFYRLTEDGREHLGAASPRWLRFAEAVASVLAARERPAV